jgi:UDP-N-acetylglucosamine 2-epimerase (non-hydrolysing)
VDSKSSLLEIYDILELVSHRVRIVYPIHPRTHKMLIAFNLLDKFSDLDHFILLQPLGYLDFMKLITEALFVLTDSGGIQEETTFLNIPCLTLRSNTERPVTVDVGSNQVVGRDIKLVGECVSNIVSGNVKDACQPKYWDGKTAERIVEILRKKEVF